MTKFNFFIFIGRLDRHVYIKPPTLEERVSILKLLGNTMKFSQDVNLEEIARKTENYTGADLNALIQKAAFLAFKRYHQNKFTTEVCLICLICKIIENY